MPRKTDVVRSLLVFSVVIVQLLAGFASTVKPTQAQGAVQAGVQAKDSVPRFEEDKCSFTAPDGLEEGKNLKCGFVIVPEDHAKPDGPTIKLAVAQLLSDNKDNKDNKDNPVIYLEGGPGGDSLASMKFYYSLFKPFLKDRDVIFFDQRGTGSSEPALTCPNANELYYKQLEEDVPVDQSIAETLAALKDCHKNLASKGVHFDKYNTIQSSADVDAIRDVLGYKQLNLYGISYGTRLALGVMRDFPKSIRSVVIDSVVPLEGDFNADITKVADRAFNAVFDTCASNAVCNTAYPDLKNVFYKLVDDLNKKPVRAQATGDKTGQTYNVVINGDQLINFMFQTLYVSDYIPYLPSIIYQAKGGRYNTIATLLVAFVESNEDIAEGMYHSVKCNEEVAFDSVDNLNKQNKGLPSQLIQTMGTGGKEEFSVCEFWGAGKGPAKEDQPVKSDIPTLVSAGHFDPITPFNYAQQVAANLSSSTVVEIPGGGHGASLLNECTTNTLVAFFDAPTKKPDVSCIEKLTDPLWAVPLKSALQDMKPFTNKTLGISGLAPDGWVQTEDGVFVANVITDAGPEQLKLVHRVRKDGVQGYLDFVSKGNNINVSKPKDTLEANGLKWDLYSADTTNGATFDIAATEVDGVGYIIALVSPTDDRDTLYNKVFLPDVKAYKVTSK